MASSKKSDKKQDFPEIVVSDRPDCQENGEKSFAMEEARLFETRQKVEAAKTELDTIIMAQESARRETEGLWKDINETRAHLENEWKNIEAAQEKIRVKRAELDKKETELKRARLESEESLNDMRVRMEKDLEEEKEEERRKLREENARKLQDMLAEMERERETETEKWKMFEEKRRKDAIDALEMELAQNRKRSSEDINAQYARLRADLDEYEKRDAELRRREVELSTRDAQLAAREKRLEIRQEQLNEEVGRISGDRISALRQELEVARAHAAEQSQHIIAARELLGKYELLKNELGGKTPSEVLETIRLQYEELSGLHERLYNEPSEAAQAMRERMEKDVNYYRGLAEQRQKQLDALAHAEEELLAARADLEDVIAEKERIKQMHDLLQGHNNDLQKEIEHYRNATGTEKDRDERIKKINEFTFTDIPFEGEDIKYIKPHDPVNGKYDEIKWLESLEKNMAEYGFVFPRRLLYAFHTSLKIAEWSPITVLAGVSGTGKSELPRLYSLFGGINFLSLPVQPNWNSQDDLLGYYNVIDNYFAAQPVLKLLAQTRMDTSQDKLGLKDAMTIILLDEMNLAHIELYFAQFLSKFELRRGQDKEALPEIEVNLGSGMFYPLALDRNVLWVGTMNQDETTKSLSDKVLDRGIMLHFPRPDTLERRKKLERLPSCPTELLPRSAWAQWVKFSSPFLDNEIRPFKNFVEEINRLLAVTGRALGHRVWQSMEYYMANYPTVRWRLERYRKATPKNEAAQGRVFGDEKEFENDLRTAFEDQLVQKVMPKLRGIETGGLADTECLKKIENLLAAEEYDIVDDFRNACVAGYGQFIWNSSSYLKNDPPLPGELAEEAEKEAERG